MQISENRLLAIYEAVDLMLTLLPRHPLSQRREPEAAVEPTTEDHANATGDDSSEQDSTTDSASTQASSYASIEPEVWPTPKPKQWRDIELVASRAGVAVDWAFSLPALPQDAQEVLDLLQSQLRQLVELLVIGHLPDWRLDMSTLFKAALQPVLSALLAGHEQYTALAVAMLSRLAIDGRLVPESMTDAAVQIIMIFCEL